MTALSTITPQSLNYPQLEVIAQSLDQLSRHPARIATARALDVLKVGALPAVRTIAINSLLMYACSYPIEYARNMLFSTTDDEASESGTDYIFYGFNILGPSAYEISSRLYRVTKLVYNVRISAENLGNFYKSLDQVQHLFTAVLSSEDFISREALSQVMSRETQELYHLPQLTPCNHIVNQYQGSDSDLSCPHAGCSVDFSTSSLEFDWVTHLKILKVVGRLLIHFAENDLGRDPNNGTEFSPMFKSLGKQALMQIENIHSQACTLSDSFEGDERDELLLFGVVWLNYRGLLSKRHFFGMD